MKKILILLSAIIIIYFIATMALSKFMLAETQENPQEEMYQTWEEFLESGVKIQYDETPATMDDANN